MLSNQSLEAVLVQGGWILGIMEETSWLWVPFQTKDLRKGVPDSSSALHGEMGNVIGVFSNKDAETQKRKEIGRHSPYTNQ